MSFLHIILLVKNSLQQQIHFDGNIFGTNDVVVKGVHCNISTNLLPKVTGYGGTASVLRATIENPLNRFKRYPISITFDCFEVLVSAFLLWYHCNVTNSTFKFRQRYLSKLF